MIKTTELKINYEYSPAQVEIFETLPQTYQHMVIPKGRRVGATYGAAVYCIIQASNGKNILWVDTIQLNLDIYYRKYFLDMLKQMPTGSYNYRAQMKDLQIGTGTVYFRSAERPENIEGFAYDIIILNEAGIILKGQHGRDLWYSTVYPMTIDHAAKVFFIGTPKGQMASARERADETLYYELAKKGGLDGNPAVDKWVCKTYSTYDNPWLDEANIQKVEDDVPYAIRQQEILGRFIDHGQAEIFHDEWFHISDQLPAPDAVLRKVISLDTAFKKESYNDASAGVVILETKNGNYFIVDCFKVKLEFPELVSFVNKFCGLHVDARYILIEDKASGQGLIQVFKTDFVIPVKAIQVSTDKLSRTNAITNLFERGRVYLYRGPWNNLLKNELMAFSGALDTPDDIVDAVSQGLNFLNESRPEDSSRIITRHVQRSSSILQGYPQC
jgi:predicted phage terminase large subunit-like protein